MEKHFFQKRPPRNSIPSPIQAETVRKINDSSKETIKIDEILKEEHKKLLKELSKLSSLRTKSGFIPQVSTENFDSDDSNDIEEFSNVPISPRGQNTSNINSTIYKTQLQPSRFSRKNFFEDSSNSEELLLSTYEDSMMYSPPHCTSPTYIRIDSGHQSPKLFLVNPKEKMNKTTESDISKISHTSKKDELIQRLSSGKKHKMSRKEIREINQRHYENLPEIKAKKAREEREMNKKINAMYAKGLQEKLKQKIKKINGKNKL